MVGIVLEGGAMRGMFTAGVLDTMMEKNIKFDGMIGVSAGAVFGANYLSNQKGRVIRYNKKFNGDKRYMGVSSLIKTGNIVNTEFAYGVVPNELDRFDDDVFKASGVPYYVGITNIETGKAEYVKIDGIYEQMDVLRASASMPFVSKPVEINGQKYLDGGISDSIPYKKFMEMGYDKIVVVLTRDESYVKKKISTLPVKVFYRKYPKLAERITERYNMYNNSVNDLKKLENEGKAFVIRPPEPIVIGKLEKDPDKLQGVYDMGVKTANAVMAELIEYIK